MNKCPIIIFTLCFFIFAFNNCEEDKNQIIKIYDSIPLDYNTFAPGVKEIDINHDSTNDIILVDTSWVIYYGPHEYSNGYCKAKSINPNLSLSFRKNTLTEFYKLGKDSVVDESVEWKSEDYIYININNFFDTFEHVGIRYEENQKIYYGWITALPFQECFSEYAIDTSITGTGKVYVGRMKK
jgi:hypothetical protein